MFRLPPAVSATQAPWTLPNGGLLLTTLQLLLPPTAATLAGLLLARDAGRGVEPAGLVLLACGALFAYLHDRLEPGRRAEDRLEGRWREAALSRLVRPLWGLAGLAGLTGLGAFLLAPWNVRVTALLLAGVALAYPRLARVPLGKTLAVALSWATAAALLPTGASPAALVEGETLALLAVVFAAAALCDLKDRAADARARVWSLPNLAGPRAAMALAAVAGLVGAAIAIAAGSLGLAGAGLGIAVLSTRPRWLADERVGPLLVDGWLLLAFALPLTAAH